MVVPIFHVDAFAGEVFSGNPAAVCFLSGPAPDDWMQRLAAEMNLSETAFLWPDGDRFRLRWFTPRLEVELCGHATLAAAHALWESGHVPPRDAIRFETKSGPLAVVKDSTEPQWLWMDFPAILVEPCATPAGLLEALDLTPSSVLRSRFDYVVVLDDEAAVRGIRADFSRLATIPTRGVIVTAPAAMPEVDYVSRFFAPAVGINEDPVTGSAHCALGPYWQARLDRNPALAYQCSARGGFVRVRVDGNRVFLGGQAVTAHSGKLSAVACPVPVPMNQSRT